MQIGQNANKTQCKQDKMQMRPNSNRTNEMRRNANVTKCI